MSEEREHLVELKPRLLELAQSWRERVEMLESEGRVGAFEIDGLIYCGGQLENILRNQT